VGVGRQGMSFDTGIAMGLGGLEMEFSSGMSGWDFCIREKLILYVHA
jgi:hypothetical protein